MISTYTTTNWLPSLSKWFPYKDEESYLERKIRKTILKKNKFKMCTNCHNNLNSIQYRLGFKREKNVLMYPHPQCVRLNNLFCFFLIEHYSAACMPTSLKERERDLIPLKISCLFKNSIWITFNFFVTANLAVKNAQLTIYKRRLISNDLFFWKWFVFNWICSWKVEFSLNSFPLKK